MNKPHPQEDLRPYRRFGMSVLQLMGLIALLGIVGTVVLSLLLLH